MTLMFDSLCHGDGAEDDRSRADVTGIRRLLQLGHSPIEIGIGPCQLALLHHTDLVIRGASYLILECFAASAMADRQALDAMLRQLPVLRDVIGLCLGPLAVMTRIE